MFSFVTRKGEDILQEAWSPCGGFDRPLESHSFDAAVFGHRVVFGFFEGQFTTDEVNHFMEDLATHPGTAPMAENYFESYSEDLRVDTGGITFESINLASPKIRSVITEFSDVNLINKTAFLCIRAEWFNALRVSQAMCLPMNEP